MVKGKFEKIFETVSIVICVLIALICLYPFLYSVFVSICGEAEWTRRNGLLLFMPSKPTFQAYLKIFGVGGYVLNSLLMSFLRTIVGTISSLVFTAIVGYVLSIEELPGKKQYTYFMLFTIFFAGGLIPNYIVVKQLNLMNSFWALILPNIINAWNALILRQFFKGIPQEIKEAAQMDGVSELGMFIKIIIPMSTPALASIGLFTMVFHFNSWFDVMIYIDQTHSQLWTLQYYIMINYNNMSQVDSTKLPVLDGGGVTKLTSQMALTITGFVPILCIYPFFQRFFKDGVYTGAVKG